MTSEFINYKTNEIYQNVYKLFQCTLQTLTRYKVIMLTEFEPKDQRGKQEFFCLPFTHITKENSKIMPMQISRHRKCDFPTITLQDPVYSCLQTCTEWAFHTQHFLCVSTNTKFQAIYIYTYVNSAVLRDSHYLSPFTGEKTVAEKRLLTMQSHTTKKLQLGSEPRQPSSRT